MELNPVKTSCDLKNNIENHSNYSNDIKLDMDIENDDDVEKNNFLKKFDYYKKIELVKKIQKIKKSEYLINVFKIIKKYSKNYNINNNGVFVFFHDLSEEAYENVEKYVNSIYKLHKKTSKIDVSNSESNVIQSIISDTIESDNEKELSNKEKIIMRRKKYEKYLNHNRTN